MNRRRVQLSIEVETDVPLIFLRNATCVEVLVLDERGDTNVCGILQVQANVIDVGDAPIDEPSQARRHGAAPRKR